MFGGDEAIFLELIEAYLESSEEIKTNIKSSFENKNNTEFEAMMHKLKGATSNFRVEALDSQIDEIYELSQSKDVAETYPKYVQMLGNLEALEKELRAYLK